MGALLGLLSAALYGVADALGGVLSRRWPPVRVALAGQVGGLVVTAAAAPLAGGTAPTSADLAWGALSGAGTGVAMVFLFRGMSRGAMSVVIPVSAVGGLALPVLVTTVLLGERPSAWAWAGITLALPALWLVSRTRTTTADTAAGVRDGLVASVGIALQYLALAQASPGAGLWPVTSGRVTAVLVVAAMALLPALLPVHRAAPRPAPAQPLPLRVTALAGLTGVLAAAALFCYLLATRTALVAVASALSCLYPVVPVLVGLTFLRERPGRTQAAGLVLALAACALIVVP